MPAIPPISAIIPAYNAERYLAKAIRSIQQQSLHPIEIIVVDDGSTDRTPEIARGISGVRCVSQENQGPGAARNHGLRLARGEIIAFLDADDSWAEGKLELQHRLLSEDPGIEIVIGYSQTVDLEGWKSNGPIYVVRCAPGFYLSFGAALVRRKSFDRVGRFDERMPMGEDIDWFLHAKELGVPMRFHHDVVQYYLRHDQNTTRDREETSRHMLRVLKRSMDRRKALPGEAVHCPASTGPANFGSWKPKAKAQPAKGGQMTGARTISAIIPAYNAGRYLAEAIESILAQSLRPAEIVVVDDGSTDETHVVVKRFGAAVRYAFQPHAGIGAARNRGVELAGGEMLAFLDADDLWTPSKLACQMAAFASAPPPDLVFGQVVQFPSPEIAEEVVKKIAFVAQPTPGYLPSAMLLRRETFLRVGPFATHWEVGEWVDWYVRAIDLGLRSLMLPEVVQRRRIHDTNQGIRKRDAQTEYVRIVKASLDRRAKMRNSAPSPDAGRN